MSQHDQVIANASAAAVRADINNALGAIFSNSSGSSAPSPTLAYQFWADTTANLMKMRNSANSGWITLYSLDGTSEYLGDVNYFSSIVSSNARLTFDANDYIEYTRASNAWDFRVGGASKLTVDSVGAKFDANYYAAISGANPILQLDANDYLSYIRSTNEFSLTIAAANIFLASSQGFGSIGFFTKPGTAGAYQGNRFNIAWSGTQANLWIDTNNFGVISLTSDYRIKRNIEPMADGAIDRIMALNPVTYQHAAYGIFEQSDTVREGFIAHEVADVIPSGVEGAKDAPDQIQSLRIDAMISVLVKAFQELTARIEALESTGE